MARIFAGAFASAVVLLALAVGRGHEGERAPAARAAVSPAASTGTSHGDLLYGRITTTDGETYEGRLRFGGDEEALWGNYFNGYREENPWVGYVPAERLPKERRSFELFNVEVVLSKTFSGGRPFMARFGDIARIEAEGRDLRVTLRSGTVAHLDRYAADDYADGIRVWDRDRGVVDFSERRIRSIEFLPAPRQDAAPVPLYGTVRTRTGEFAGFIQWDREACLTTDELTGRTGDGPLSLPFASIRSIARRSAESAGVTLNDGREVVLSGTHRTAPGGRGMYVDDPRYGRVLVSWEAFERVDFGSGGAAPAYGDFEAGRPLEGTVITRAGRHLAGRLVYDLDESETTETLDAPWQGVDYTIPFRLIASIAPAGPTDSHDDGSVRVTLRAGEEIRLEPAGDLGDANAGILVFAGGAADPVYVPWSDVAEIRFEPVTEQETQVGR